MLHNKYKIRGGEDESTEAEISLLRKNGVEVDVLYVDNDQIQNLNQIKVAINSIWSNHFYTEIKKKIKENNYDIVHVQNFFPLLSPSIFFACKKTNTKVVMSVRNYRLICPNALLFINGSVCKECVGKMIPYHAIKKKCYRENYLATATVVSMLAIHNIINTWNSKINGLICTSEFVKSQLLLAGYKENQLFVKNNFITTHIEPNFLPKDYYIFVGRLSVEKGIDVILKTFKHFDKKLLIIGDGPLKEMILKEIAPFTNITYLGKKSLNDTYEYIAGAKALIQPSKCHETFGRTIVEAYAHGTPVIASNLGGMTELVINGENGFLFNPYQENDLYQTIIDFEEAENHNNMRRKAYNTYLQKFLPNDSYYKSLSIYNKIMSI